MIKPAAPVARFLNSTDICARLRISRSKLNKMVKEKQFPEPASFGGMRRWPVEIVERWEQAMIRQVEAQAAADGEGAAA